MSTAWHNRFLFSHHYLEELCQDADDRTEAAHLVDALRGWTGSWDDRTLSKLIGTQVGPTLVSLGFTYGEPGADEDPHRLRLYASYRKEQQLGVCYVAHREDVETELESTINGRHYAAEIVHALQEDELSWGLLTDGERWRLYHANELAPYETYLEIDLAPVLQGHGGGEAGDAAFLLHTLFRQSAFARTEDGACALEDHLATSQRAASRIEKHLSGCIEEVLRDLCQGFVERDGKATYTSEERDEVFRNATVLLYRMLFMLYAEARELLPRDEPAYAPVSLDALVEQAVDYVRGSGLPNPDGTVLWQALSNLSSWISSGNDERQIPAYNGDLFDDSDKHYIHDQTIADKYLAPALFSLGSLEDEATETGARRIDYRDLSVRHLGSIYEGLLEYKLFIARERRVRRSDGKGGYTFPKLSEMRLKKGEEENVIAVGDVYFANSAGERKAMGAYYTPEYIVDYIVKQTVLRGLQERRASLEEQLPGWIADVEAAPPGDRARLQAVVDQKLVDFVEQQVLTFRVCDPAMGSGHFLVNTVHAMTNFIVETLNLTPWENPKIDCDPVRWRRRVAKRCLYGVDLNELAVELAKLSLWLTTVAQGKPLSFLDHHLRHGNSLIGLRLEELIEVLSPKTNQDQASENGQLSMFDKYPAFRVPLMEALDLMRDISARLADAAEDVEAQAADYEQLRRELKPYRDLADLITARHFGVDVDESRMCAIAHRLLDADLGLADKDRDLLDRAHEVARNQSFFHWDLEFPEIFAYETDILPDNDLGFDAAIGNPPYLVLKPSSISQEIYGFIVGTFETLGYKKNLYLLFIERATQLTSSGGVLGIIIPEGYLRIDSYSQSRNFLARHFLPIAVMTFQDNVFEGATVGSAILILHRRENLNTGGHFPIYRRTPEGVELVREMSKSVFSPDADFIIETQSTSKMRDILDQIDSCSVPLKDLVRINIGMMIRDRDEVVHSTRFPKASLFVYGKSIGRYRILEKQFARYSDLEIYGGTKSKDIHSIVPKGLLRRTGDRLVFTITYEPTLTECTLYMLTQPEVSLEFLASILNSKLLTFYFRQALVINPQAYPQLLISVASKIPVRRIRFETPSDTRSRLVEEGKRLYNSNYIHLDQTSVLSFLVQQLDRIPERSDVIHDLLSHLGACMIDMYNAYQKVERRFDLFRYVDYDCAFVQLDETLIVDESQYTNNKINLVDVYHDIDGLRLTPNEDGTWTLELQAKFRDPEQGWREWVKEEDGYSIKRRWVPAYRLRLSEEKARFYHYALPRLQDFDNARSFPGGYTRSTLKKLHLTQVPMMPDVDLSELARLDRELTETKRKIRFTDDLIDQIVYKLYGLTEEEIAIVEGRA